ncbi:MAG: PulJ/GspJ family protein [Desulfitobacteriaceae bacterium]
MKRFRIRYYAQVDGFTLLEVMIAISIFGLLMLYVTQFMKLEIGTFNTAAKESALEQKARIAVMHVLDEERLHSYTFYQTGPSQDGSDGRGIYRTDYTDPMNPVSVCLVDLQPPGNSPKADIYYDNTEEAQGNGKLYYQVPRQGNPSILDKYLIADSISLFTIEPVNNDRHLGKIHIKVGKTSTNNPQPYELITWVRLY